MRLLFIITFTFIASYLQCQIITGLEDSKINFTKRDSIINQKELTILESYDIYDVDINSLWAYYLYKSSLYFYLGKDSVLYNLNLAFTKNERAVCKELISTENLITRVISIGVEPPDFSMYLWDIPDSTESYIRDRCKEYSDEIVRKTEEEKARKQSEIENFIITNDQKYRGDNEMIWEFQNKLDLINRNYLDSLYSKYNSFAKFNLYEQDAFSFVLHHSNDCAWNKKWIIIWLEEINKGTVKGGKLFGEAIKRMLEPEKGVCWIRDPYGTTVFIDILKRKYSKKKAIKYGYYNY